MKPQTIQIRIANSTFEVLVTHDLMEYKRSANSAYTLPSLPSITFTPAAGSAQASRKSKFLRNLYKAAAAQQKSARKKMKIANYNAARNFTCEQN